MTEDIEALRDEIVHEPDESFVESANITAFMDEYGIADHDELIERITSLDGEFILSYGEVLPDGLGDCRQEMMDHPTSNKDRTERLFLSFPNKEEGTFDIPTTGDPADEW